MRKARLHVVWTVVSVAGIGEAIYYARLESDHTSWSTPIALAVRNKTGYQVAWASITVYNSELFVIYEDDVVPESIVPTRWMRRSTDGGKTWTTPTKPFSYVGEYGHADFAIDSGNVMHLILGNRTVNTEIHGLWHGIWLGDR